VPQAVIIIDVPREYNAVLEARALDIPTIAICDTNANPDGIGFVIPGNDDASRAIQLYCDLFVGAILSGIEKRLGGVESKKVADTDLTNAAADEIEEKALEKEAHEKSHKSERVEIRKRKTAEKADAE